MSERGKIHILLVEDNPGDARLIAALLEETSFAHAKLIIARSLQEALRPEVEPSKVAMVLVDLNLPDSSGLATLDALLEPYASSACVVLTGLDDASLAMDALRNGAQNYLAKDTIDPVVLDRELRYAVERHGFVMRLREAEHDLKDRERRFRSLVEHSSDITLTVDRHGGIRYASPVVHRLFGFVQPGTDLEEQVLEEDRRLLAAALHQARTRQEHPVELLLRFRTPEGRLLLLEGTITDLSHFAIGALVVNLHDVTDRDAALRTVIEERNIRDMLIDSTTDMIWSVDRDMRVLTANRWFVARIEEIAGYTIRPGVSIVPTIDFGSHDSDRWTGYYQRALMGESFTVEEHTRGAKPMWGDFSFNPIREGNSIVGVVCACRDITERKYAEEEIRRMNQGLEERVLERTRQLIEANRDLEEHMATNQRLSNALESRNQDLMDSISYARRLQDTLFPVPDALPYFRGCACLTVPRDGLSGDFVWHHDTPERLFVVVADCTGHGVPGAMLSILAHGLLNQLVVERRLTDPVTVLERLDTKVAKLVGKNADREGIPDGMDLALLVLDKATHRLRFAGAMMNAFLLRNGELHVLQGARHPIGGIGLVDRAAFCCESVQLEEGDRLVLFSDGYRSQFGGPDGRKLNATRFRQSIERTMEMDARGAVDVLRALFQEWKGGQEQTDDVLVLVLDV